MSIIQFPGSKNNPLIARMKISENEKKAMLDQFEKILDEVDELEHPKIDLNEMDHELFIRLVQEFPCFRNYQNRIEFQLLLDMYHSDAARLSEAQELAFEAIFELLTGHELGFVLSEAFEVWSKDDLSAFIRVLSIKSFLHYS